MFVALEMPSLEDSPPDGSTVPFELWPPVTRGYFDDDLEFQSSLPFPLSSLLPSSTTIDVARRPGRNQSTPASTGGSGSGWALQVELRIALYVAIFVLSVAGNALVALTIAQNRRMRTLTNVLLMNLSVADLLLAAFCMPFTLVPTLLRDFIFGPVVCVMVRYMQGVSVGVSAFTLVAISLERYFAICRPLRSRSWQTVSHSYKMIGAAWAGAITLMLPIAIYQRIRALPGGARKCEEVWDNPIAEQFYTAFLDVVLLVLPLVVMCTAYGLISYKLWPRGGTRRCFASSSSTNGTRLTRDTGHDVAGCGTDAAEAIDDEPSTSSRHSTPSNRRNFSALQFHHPNTHIYGGQHATGIGRRAVAGPRTADDGMSMTVLRVVRRPSEPAKIVSSTAAGGPDSTVAAARQLAALRLSGGVERCVAAKRRVVKMLFVVVVEFFVCWTPTYVLQTWYVFDSKSASARVSAVAMNLVHLLGFASACCHPITYGFMNASFRRGFAAVFCTGLRRRCAANGRSRLGRRRLDSAAACGGLAVGETATGWPLGTTVGPFDEDSGVRATWGGERRRLGSDGNQSIVAIVAASRRSAPVLTDL